MKTSHNPIKHGLTIPIANLALSGALSIPAAAQALVIFVHGSGSSRFSPRNQYVADVLNDNGMATLLFDLLTAREEEIDNINRRLRFDISLLSSRVVEATHWLQRYTPISDLSLGYFGASTGAAAALIAAAHLPKAIKAVVSRGGRPDLAGAALYHVLAPTLLIVGENDAEVLTLNQEAAKLLPCIKHISTIACASHLFEERGTLEQAATQAASWFSHYLTDSRELP